MNYLNPFCHILVYAWAYLSYWSVSNILFNPLMETDLITVQAKNVVCTTQVYYSYYICFTEVQYEYNNVIYKNKIGRKLDNILKEDERFTIEIHKENPKYIINPLHIFETNKYGVWTFLVAILTSIFNIVGICIFLNNRIEEHDANKKLLKEDKKVK